MSFCSSSWRPSSAEGGGQGGKAFVGQDARERFPDGGLVVDDENGVGHGSPVGSGCSRS